MSALLIDDEETMQTVMAAFLRRYCEQKGESLAFTGLTDPLEGLRELEANGGEYDLIVLDVRLPRLTGDEIYQSLSRTREELLPRVLFVTGYRNDLDERLPLAGLRVLEKPFSFDELTEQLDAILLAGVERQPA